VLEDMLGDYEGTVILISHDRDFLDRVVTSVIVPEGNGKWTEYAGGYTDMLSQRGADLKREKATSATESVKSGGKSESAKPAAKKKMNFKDKHLLDTLPKAIASFQADIAKQQRHLDDPNLYKKDRKKFDTVSAALSAAQKGLAEAEEKWLELETLREEIENA
jgi:ATP-binding cassette subfamily F protein uup